MKIRSLNARTVRVPMEHPHQTASGTVGESPLVLVDAVTEDGTAGHGIVFTYTPMALQPVAELIRNVEPLVSGETLAPIEIQQKLARRFRLLGTQGLVGMALAGIDMALWDALARSQEVSLVELLGGKRKRYPAYGAVGYGGECESARSAEEWVRRGFRGVKAKIGYPSDGEDLRVVRAIRQAIGAEAAIMVDYNQSLTPAEAVRRLRVLEDEELAWVEEPVLAHDYQGHAAVAREIRTPVQCGENWWGVQDMRHAIEAHASDYVMADAMKIGGVTGWLRAAALAEAHSIPLSTHLWPELSAQLLCVTPTAHWLEYADWWNAIVGEPLRMENGECAVDEVKGSGIEWNEAAIARFSA